MLNKKKIICTLAIIQTILITHLISCKTLPNTVVNPIQIETAFPSPYDENGKAIVTFENDGNVKMPLWYWLKITEYVIETDANMRLAQKGAVK